MTLKEYLQKKNLIHAKFAAKCGLKRSIFCRYVNGSRKPTPVAAIKIKKESGNLITEFDDIVDSHLALILNSSSM